MTIQIHIVAESGIQVKLFLVIIAGDVFQMVANIQLNIVSECGLQMKIFSGIIVGYVWKKYIFGKKGCHTFISLERVNSFNI